MQVPAVSGAASGVIALRGLRVSLTCLPVLGQHVLPVRHHAAVVVHIGDRLRLLLLGLEALGAHIDFQFLGIDLTIAIHVVVVVVVVGQIEGLVDLLLLLLE